MKKQENGKTIILVLETIGPVHTYSDIFEIGDFFLRVNLPSTCKRRFLAPKTQVFENGSRSGDFLKRRLLSFNANGRKKVFEYFDVIHILLALRMPGRGIYYNFKTSNVLAFLSGRAN